MPHLLRRTLAEPRAVIGGVILLLVLFVAVFAPVLAPHDPAEQDLLRTLLPPAWLPGGDWEFPLGTDSLGRCTLSQLLFGARVAKKVAVAAAAGAAIVGSILALLAGYFGGAVDWLVSRAVDVWMSFPPVVLSLIFMVGFGAGLANVILAIIIVDWTRFCRIVRSEVLAVAKRDYVPAARLAGFTHLQIIVKEILPAVPPPLLTLISNEMGIALIVDAIRSFVCLSLDPNMRTCGL